MLTQFSRTELLIGKEGISKLEKCKVAVFGIGGVGSFVVEGLARCGVGHFILVDDDTVCKTNINRQLIALHSTIGKPKVEVAKTRILDINPNAVVEIHKTFYFADNAEELIKSDYDYIVDAIDSVSSKIDLITQAKKRNIPIISSMGMGNKLNPTMIEVSDISKTSICPLAKVVRKELKKREIYSLKVIYSKEQPIQHLQEEGHDICANDSETGSPRRQIPGSIAFVPSVAGLIIASEVIKDVIKK